MVLIGPQLGPASVFCLLRECHACLLDRRSAQETTNLGEINCLFANKAINGPFIGHDPIYIAEEVLRRRQINVRSFSLSPDPAPFFRSAPSPRRRCSSM